MRLISNHAALLCARPERHPVSTYPNLGVMHYQGGFAYANIGYV